MRAVVIGGGIAGSVTAIGLARLGAEVTIVEAHPDPGGDVGSFLSLASNGLRGLAAIGCLERVTARGFPVIRQRMWTGSGKLLGDVPRGRMSSDELHSITLMRGHLVAELRQAADEAGVRIVTGERVTDLETHIGTDIDTGRVDLVVGADGIWSTTRRSIDPQAPVPVYAGLYTLSGVSSAASGIEVEPAVFNMVFARNGAFIYVRAADGTIWWQAQIASPSEPDRDGVDDAEWLRRLRDLYAAEPMPAAVIAATTTLHRPVINHVLEPVPTWTRRRTVLVGDAAHPVGAGQGASMAIEGGVELVAAVRQAGSIPDALIAYESRRRARVTRLLKAADDNRDLKKAGALQRRVERVLMPVFFRYFYERATAWLYTYRPTEEAAEHEQPFPAQAAPRGQSRASRLASRRR